MAQRLSFCESHPPVTSITCPGCTQGPNITRDQSHAHMVNFIHEKHVQMLKKSSVSSADSSWRRGRGEATWGPLCSSCQGCSLGMAGCSTPSAGTGGSSCRPRDGPASCPGRWPWCLWCQHPWAHGLCRQQLLALQGPRGSRHWGWRATLRRLAQGRRWEQGSTLAVAGLVGESQVWGHLGGLGLSSWRPRGRGEGKTLWRPRRSRFVRRKY